MKTPNWLRNELNVFENKLWPYFIGISSFASIFLTIYYHSHIKWIDIVLLVSTFVVYGFAGIIVGYHRYFTHRAFKCKPWLKYTLLILGNMTCQGSARNWVKMHRLHHRYTDKPGDPHSPNLIGISQKKWVRFIHAHVGWAFRHNCIAYSFKSSGISQALPSDRFDSIVSALNSDPLLVKLDNLWVLWWMIGMILPGIIAGLWTQSWEGAGMGILIGGFLANTLTLQSTLSVNSFSHMFGSRAFHSNDNSRNCWFPGIFNGEGWHNMHHSFPASAKLNLQWKNFYDPGYFIIWILNKFGAIWDIQIPSQSQMDSKRIDLNLDSNVNPMPVLSNARKAKELEYN